MGEFAKWLPQISWIDLVAGIGVGVAVLGGLIALAFFLRPRDRQDENDIQHGREVEQRRLLCEDAKILADLAIQRHMSDLAFLERFRIQPCYEALFSHFSAEFRERLTQPARRHGHSELAIACREECERLEQQWRAG